MSGIRRHFLDWDEPLCRKVCTFLFPVGVPSCPDLESTLIVVPTKQAGRRLSEAVALYCAECGSRLPVLGLRVVPPTFFLETSGPVPEASPSLVKTVWADVLQRKDISDFKGLFPTDTPSRDAFWSLRLGETIQALRDSLAEGGFSIADALAGHSDKIEELDRWQDLARLEVLYLEALGRLAQEDPCIRKMRLSCDPELPGGVTRVVVAAVPDPTLLLTRALDRLAASVQVDILIYAPPALRDGFDSWGRPVPARWTQAMIPVPEPAANILLAASPADQSRKALEVMASTMDSCIAGPADAGIGVPDPSVTPFLQADLAERNIPTFDPAGKRVMETPLGRLLALLRDLQVENTYAAFAALVRHPDVLDYLDHKHDLRPLDVLSELDDCQQKHLPTGWKDLQEFKTDFARTPTVAPALCRRVFKTPRQSGAATEEPRQHVCVSAKESTNIQSRSNGHTARTEPRPPVGTVESESRKAEGCALSQPERDADRGRNVIPILSFAIERLVVPVATDPLPSALRKILAELYSHRAVSSDKPEDREFADIAAVVDEALHEIDALLPVTGAADTSIAFELFLQRLENGTYEPDRPPDAVDLEGWLELPWSDAPLLIVTGMNEGFVPDTRVNDIFLPDRLRRDLGLRDDQARFARDVYLAQSLLEWRRKPQAGSRVVFIAGRAGVEGDPLKPSRLLFRCPDDDLLERTSILFAEPREKRETVPLKIGMRLNPEPPRDLPAGRLPVTALNVTAFSSYLECPFRFYLGHVLGMEALDPGKNAMDDRDFGTLVHAALCAMANDAEMRVCRDADVLAGFLRKQVEAAAHRQYGADLPLLVRLQVEAAQQRLTAAAHTQSRLVEEGWEIVQFETKYRMDLDGIVITGKVDRIDRHAGTGLLRVLDYKTSDKASTPREAHLRGVREDTRDYAKVLVAGASKSGPTERAWQDLQLPLYRLMVLARPEFAGQPCEIGYFNLPKAVADTDVKTWEAFTEDMAAAAETCARGVVADIRGNRFWPPSERVRNDEFENLFPSAAEECFDTTTFLDLLRETARRQSAAATENTSGRPCSHAAASACSNVKRFPDGSSGRGTP